MAGKTEIASLAVKLTAEASEFNKAVDAAGVKLHDLAQAGGRGFDFKAAAGMGASALQNPMGALVGAAGGGVGALGAAAGGPIGAALHGAKEAAEKLWETVLHVGEAFHETTKRAEEFGISTRAMVGMAITAKDRADEWEVGLQRLQRTIGEAAGGSKEAQAKFTALGLSWRDLEASTLDVAAGKVNDQIRKSGSHAAMAAAAFELYGRQGQRLMRIIEQGSAGIEAGQAKALGKGLVPDEQFTKSYEQYLAAKKDLDRTWQGLKNQFAVYLGTPLLKLGEGLAGGTSMAVDAMLGRSPADAAAEAGRQRAEEAAAARAQAAAAEQARRAKFAAETLQTARETQRQLELQLATVGQSAEQAKMYELNLRGAGKAVAEARAALQRNLELHEAITRAQDQDRLGKQLTEETLTPLERWQKKMAEIRAAFNAGKISADVFGRASVKALEDLDRASGGMNSPLGLLQFGSQADRTFGLQQERAGEGLDRDKVEAKALAVHEQIKAKAERLVQIGERQLAVEEANRMWEERLSAAAH